MNDLADQVEDLEQTLPKLDVAPLVIPDFRGRKLGSIPDAALVCFGALLWAYVIAGELVVGANLPESMALLAVLLVFGSSWYSTVAPAWRAGAGLPRLLAPVLLALGAFFLALLFACSVAGPSAGEVQAISVSLWFLAVFAFSVGRERVRRRATARTASPEQKAARFALWLIAGVLTLTALIVGMSRL